MELYNLHSMPPNFFQEDSEELLGGRTLSDEAGWDPVEPYKASLLPGVCGNEAAIHKADYPRYGRSSVAYRQRGTTLDSSSARRRRAHGSGATGICRRRCACE